jgi:hypothetical protein
MRRPIVAFPKKAIEDVCKVDVNCKAFMERKHYDKTEENLFNNMFEIYLREDYEDIYKFRDEEIRQASLNRSAQSCNTS